MICKVEIRHIIYIGCNCRSPIHNFAQKKIAVSSMVSIVRHRADSAICSDPAGDDDDDEGPIVSTTGSGKHSIIPVFGGHT